MILCSVLTWSHICNGIGNEGHGSALFARKRWHHSSVNISIYVIIDYKKPVSLELIEVDQFIWGILTLVSK